MQSVRLDNFVFDSITPPVLGPTITSVTPPANKTYKIGDYIDVVLNTSTAITVDGIPYIPITLDTGGVVNAAYLSGSGTSTLTFRYTVVSGDLDADGISVGSAISLNSGTMKDAEANDLALTFTSPTTTGVRVDGVAPAAPSTPDLADASDSGSSSSDNLTNIATPTFTGSAETGSSVTLYDGATVLGTATATGGTWSIESSSLSAGAHTITAQATDAAGNVGAASGGLSVTIDTSAPTAATPVRADLSAPSGLASLTFTVDYTDTGGAGIDTSTFGTGNVSISGAADSFTITDAQASGNTVTYTATHGGNWVAGDSGTYTIALVADSVKDLAGNAVAANVAAKTFEVLDNVAPTLGGTFTTAGTVSDNATSTPFSGVTYTDPDGTSYSATITYTAANGSLSGTGLTGSAGSYTVTGADAATVQANLRALVFTPTANQVAPVSTVQTTFTLTPNDGSNTGTANTTTVVTATSINDAPTNAALSVSSVAENTSTASALTVGAFSSTDPDTGDTFTYSIVGGADEADFQISGGNLQFKAGTVLNFEAKSSYAVTVRSTDAGGMTFDKPLTVTLSDVNEAPTVDNATVNQSASATQAFSYAFAANTFADVDAGQTLTYTATKSDDSALPTWLTFTPATRTFSGTPALGDVGTVSVKVTAIDNGTGTLSVSDTFDLVVAAGPGVSSIVRAGSAAALTNASTVSYTVTFNESVTGVDTTDFALTNGGSAAGTIASVTGSGTTYTVVANSVSGDGTLRLDLNSSGTGIVNGASTAITSGFTAGQSYTLDHTAPTITIGTIALSADTGTSSSDFITKTAAQTISGTVSANMEADEIVEVSLDNGTTWVTATTTTGQNTWSLAGQTLTGSDTLKVRVSDLAGNTGTVASQAYVLDTTAPITTFSALSLSADTGPSSTDFNTQTAAQTVTATLSVAPAGSDKVFGSVDGGSNWIDITSMVSGTTLTWTGVTLAGSSSLQLRVTDAAGNDGTIATQAYALDTTAPTASVTTATVATGNSVSTGQGSEPGVIYLVSDSVTVTDLASLEAAVTAATATKATVLASNTNTSMGTTGLAVGGYHVYTVDAAGNVSAISTNAITLAVGPNTTVTGAVFSADTGTSSTDLITQTAAQTISGTLSAVTVTGETVELSLDNGVTWATATNTVGQSTWSLAGQTLTASNTLQVRVSNAVGSATALSQAYVLDTAAPTATISTTTFSADTGTSSTDLITNTAAQTISGTVSTNMVAGEMVQVSLDGGTTWVTAATTTGSTVWSLASQTLPSGSGTVKVRVADLAGNTGTETSQAYTLDTTAPTASIASASFSADTGTSSTDLITNTAVQTISGTVSANMVTGEMVQVSLDGGTTWVTAATTTGSSAWSLDSQTLTGSGTLQVRVTDSAGNSGTALSQAYVFDNTAPTLNASGSTPADNATSTSTSADIVVAFAEPLATNSDLTKVYLKTVVGGVLVPATVTLNSSGQLVINPTADLPNSTAYFVSWDANALLDAAGNAAAAVSDQTSLNFTTAAASGGGGGGDSGSDDQDGVDASIEDSVPGLEPKNGGPAVAGDGNGDGIKDSVQAAVSSLTFLKTDTSVSNPGNAPKVFVTLVADSKDGQVNADSKAVITSIAQKDAPANLPEGAKLPLGLFDFTAKAATPGSTENFSIFIDGDITVNGYWKEVHSGPSAGTWVNLADATYGGKIVTEQGKTRLDFSIQDGGIFDDDGKADGTITDPGGPGFMVVAAPTCPFDPFRIDADKDGMTDAVELLRGSSSAMKNNDVFSHNDLFVDQLYRDFLGREGYGDAGSAYWLNAMSTGLMSRADVLTSVLSSPEFDSHAGVVIRLYHATLGRSPEFCGYNYWLDQANAGMSASQMGSNFLASAEFATKQAGLDNAGFVDLMYHNVLQREPEAAGRAYWIDQLQTGKTDRGGMLYSVVQSQEFKAAMVDDVAVDILYLGLLDRTAGAQETAYWMGQYSKYADPTTFLQAASAATTEYHDRFMPNDGSTHAVALVGVVEGVVAV